MAFIFNRSSKIQSEWQSTAVKRTKSARRKSPKVGHLDSEKTLIYIHQHTHPEEYLLQAGL